MSCLAWGQERFTATVEFTVNTDFIIDNGHNYQFYHIDLPKIQEKADKILKPYISRIYSVLFEVSRDLQSKL